MALEPSVLRDGDIAALLRARYGIRAEAAERLRLGSANCYKVRAGDDTFFLKEFQSGFSEASLLREARVLSLLARRGLPVTELLSARDGGKYFSHAGRLFTLQRFVGGVTYRRDNLPRAVLMEAGEMLGRLQAALYDCELPVGMGEEWLRTFDADATRSRYDALLAANEGMRRDPHYDRIRADLLYKKDLLRRVADGARWFEGVTYRPTHGDYSALQLLCDEKRIRCVVDFSSTQTLPVAWELMRSYVLSSGAYENGTPLDAAELAAYMRAYARYAPLTPRDRQAMPRILLFQLARSRYGYSQYLRGDAENPEDMLRFAFWRTDICRALERL